MQCKHHPNRRADHFCTSCGINVCQECAEEVKQGEYFCFQCAMLFSVSEVGTSIKDKREKAAEKKIAKKGKWGPFQYFVVVCCSLIVVMWGVILFGGQKSPGGKADFAKNERVLLFMVDAAIKRHAHYEGNQYPKSLSSLVPKYLTLGEKDLIHLERLFYQKDPDAGYLLSLANPKPGDMKIIISPKGIQYELPSSQGA
ncbi:MAG: B-box zinc finger protein [Desulfatiglandales bacterium]